MVQVWPKFSTSATVIRRLRLQQAQTLLRDRHLPVADVARLSGFNDPTQMTRAFKNLRRMPARIPKNRKKAP